MKKLLFSLFAVLAFVACSDDIEEAYEITFETPTTETEAINTPFGKSTVIKFTAEAAWTAEVVSTRAVDWCSVSPTSGEAGEATITITTTTNDTSEERSAEVVLKSGSTEKTIEVTQKAAPQPNQIFYTSSDGKIVEPYNPADFGANIVSNTYENGQGVITFDSNVTTFGESAFFSCSSLTALTLPNSVTYIGGSAFKYCSSLTSVNIPEGITSIKVDTFYDCFLLTNVNIPESVTTIERMAFNGCFALPSITIPDGVTLIEENAFTGCHSLTSINIPKGVTEIKFATFAQCI